MEWKLVPIEPTDEMLNAAVCRVDEAGDEGALNNWQAMIDAAPLPPHETLTAEEARSGQHWKGMDGACAWHLIDRHAQGWDSVAKMMQAWLEANREPPNANEVRGWRQHPLAKGKQDI